MSSPLADSPALELAPSVVLLGLSFLVSVAVLFVLIPRHYAIITLLPALTVGLLACGIYQHWRTVKHYHLQALGPLDIACGASTVFHLQIHNASSRSAVLSIHSAPESCVTGRSVFTEVPPGTSLLSLPLVGTRRGYAPQMAFVVFWATPGLPFLSTQTWLLAEPLFCSPLPNKKDAALLLEQNEVYAEHEDRQGSSGTPEATVRAWTPEDGVKALAWKASARATTWLKRPTQASESPSVTLRWCDVPGATCEERLAWVAGWLEELPSTAHAQFITDTLTVGPLPSAQFSLQVRRVLASWPDEDAVLTPQEVS